MKYKDKIYQVPWSFIRPTVNMERTNKFTENKIAKNIGILHKSRPCLKEPCYDSTTHMYVCMYVCM